MSTFIQTLQVADKSATSQVFQVLNRAIITLQLPPGEKVSEAEIAKEFGISRQPVRDAFYRLASLGLLNIRPQRGPTISFISEQKLLNARFARTALEVECLRTLIENPHNIDHQRLEFLLKEQSKAIKKGDAIEFHELDNQFHKALVQMSGHEQIWQLITDQKAHIDRVCYLTLGARAELAYQEHQKLYKCIKDKNAAKAEATLRQHLANILSDLKGIRQTHAKYFD
jgi:DNA-binding GntR family transcriptional regulator